MTGLAAGSPGTEMPYSISVPMIRRAAKGWVTVGPHTSSCTEPNRRRMYLCSDGAGTGGPVRRRRVGRTGQVADRAAMSTATGCGTPPRACSLRSTDGQRVLRPPADGRQARPSGRVGLLGGRRRRSGRDTRRRRPRASWPRSSDRRALEPPLVRAGRGSSYDDGRLALPRVRLRGVLGRPVTGQPSEVADGGWMTIAELRERLADPARPFVPDGRLGARALAGRHP